MSLTPNEATAIARPIVVALCGGRWVTPPVRFTDEYPVPYSGRVILSGRPVNEVHSVSLNGTTLDPSQYRIDNGYILSLVGVNTMVPIGWQPPGLCIDHRLTIDYTYGVADLPDIVNHAVEVLANEILLADADDNSCRIPERVTSVTRQGMSWTLLDPQTFLSEGRTGIYEVDLAIKAINPKNAKRRARIFTNTTSAPALRRPS